MSNIIEDAQLAELLAVEAGRELLTVRTTGLEGKELKDAGDRASHEFLMDRLADERPDDVVLSEEGKDPAARIGAPRVWIVDPLDGTREFSELDRSDWAVHVALWEQGELVAGAISMPAEDVSYSSHTPPVVPERPDGPIRLAVSRTRPPEFVKALAEHLGAELVPMGSAGVKCASVWRGEADAYVHGGGQYEWDSAAPVAVARAAGLFTSRVDGSPLVYNREDPTLPDLIVCRPELAQTILDWTTSNSEVTS